MALPRRATMCSWELLERRPAVGIAERWRAALGLLEPLRVRREAGSRCGRCANLKLLALCRPHDEGVAHAGDRVQELSGAHADVVDFPPAVRYPTTRGAAFGPPLMIGANGGRPCFPWPGPCLRRVTLRTRI